MKGQKGPKWGDMLGRFVRSQAVGAPLGLGKLLAVDGDEAQVEYFDSPTSVPLVFSQPLSALQLAIPSAQTRIYWLDRVAGVWRMGRVIDGDDAHLAVRFPNGDERLLPIGDLFIRWDRPIADPSSYLAHWIVETPHFSDGRSGFVRALIRQRAACQGMSGLLSALIDLEAHQVEVIRRVLQDPVQRYLLADEVGLGKTIEAGVLIRQYALDDPNHRITVLVPPPLLDQWCAELKQRFLLTADGTHIRVVSTDDHAAVAEGLTDIGMLVIDEAHHLSSDAALYRMVERAARICPRLLLLSATPVLRNERSFLEMLHLLDPTVFRLEDEEQFRRKIAHRQSMAEAVAGLTPENLLLMEDFLDVLVKRFPDDALLMERVDALSTSVQGLPSEDDPQFVEALTAVRSHISEVYRLDRRILRNRRAEVPGLTPGRAGVVFADYESDIVAGFVEAWELWRTRLALRHYNRESAQDSQRLVEHFADLWEVALADPTALTEALHATYGGPDDPDDASAFQRLLSAAQAAGRDEARLECLLTALLQSGERTKCIVFCSSASVAQRLALFLTREWDGPVECLSDGEGLEAEAARQRFLDGPAGGILVCDRRHEEGLNLQGGPKLIMHWDLPLSPNRVEQRLGRLDRYGSGSAVQSVVLRCLSNPVERAWASCLAEGWGVFDRSIASLQYLVDAETQRMRAALLTDGREIIDELTERLGGPAGEVARERRRIDDQDALDALAAPAEDSLDVLFEVDDDWQEFQDRVRDWLVRCLMMAPLEGPQLGTLPPGDQVIRFALERRGHKPTLIPIDRFVSTMAATLDSKMPGANAGRPVTFPYTCRRQTALSRPGRVAGVRLLRYGDALLEGLQALTALDDRGRCFAVWRFMPAYRPAHIADVFFRFDFVVEAETSAAVAILTEDVPETGRTAEAALRRRGDMMFPPFVHRLWLDAEFRPVEDLSVLNGLNAPYAKEATSEGRQDFNLNHNRLTVVQRLGLPVLANWQAFVLEARQEAERLLFDREAIRTRGREAVERSKAADAGRFVQLQTRILQGDGAALAADQMLLEREQRVAKALYDGMLSPRVSLDTMGAVFLSNRTFRSAAA